MPKSISCLSVSERFGRFIQFLSGRLVTKLSLQLAKYATVLVKARLAQFSGTLGVD